MVTTDVKEAKRSIHTSRKIIKWGLKITICMPLNLISWETCIPQPIVILTKGSLFSLNTIHSLLKQSITPFRICTKGTTKCTVTDLHKFSYNPRALKCDKLLRPNCSTPFLYENGDVKRIRVFHIHVQILSLFTLFRVLVSTTFLYPLYRISCNYHFVVFWILGLYLYLSLLQFILIRPRSSV